MKTRMILLFCFICSVLAVACSKSEVTTNRQETAPVAASSTPAPTTAASTSAEKIGVAECDDFIAAYDTCVSSKVPEMARAQYKSSIEQWRSSWKKLADNPATRASLVTACKQTAEQAKASMKMYNCTF